MSIASELRRALARGNVAPAAVATFVAIGLFAGYLYTKNRLAQERLSSLANTDMVRYLDELRRLEGFDTYLSVYRERMGFADFRPRAPRFLIGRWTLRDEAVRLPPSGSFAECDQPLVIEYGRIAITASPAVAEEAAYRLTEDEELEVRTERNGVIPITIVAHGTRIDHLELTPPGREDRMFAYPCRA